MGSCMAIVSGRSTSLRTVHAQMHSRLSVVTQRTMNGPTHKSPSNFISPDPDFIDKYSKSSSPHLIELLIEKLKRFQQLVTCIIKETVSYLIISSRVAGTQTSRGITCSLLINFLLRGSMSVVEGILQFGFFSEGCQHKNWNCPLSTQSTLTQSTVADGFQLDIKSFIGQSLASPSQGYRISQDLLEIRIPYLEIRIGLNLNQYQGVYILLRSW